MRVSRDISNRRVCKRRILLALLTVVSTLSVMLFPSSRLLAATDDCGSCIERKQRFCSEECDAVPASRARVCQKRCILGYCSHRCSPKSPEIDALTRESCGACAERQFVLCEKHCPVGTARERAVCQIDCSRDRCEPVCHGEEPAKREEKLVPIEPEKPKGEDDEDEEEEEGSEAAPAAEGDGFTEDSAGTQ